MKWLRMLLLAAGLGVAGSAWAYTPQTIVVDGVNDFAPGNLMNDDRGDTEIKDWCTNDPANDSTMDIGRVFVTNDANFLYVGWDYFEDCFADIQLGLAFDLKNTPTGGTDDPFTRKVGWSTITNKPDAYVYIEDTAFNYEIFYKWNGSAWIDSTVLVNPAGSGSNALNATNTSRFIELRIPLTALRVVAGNVINLEMWMTQNGANKGPLDAMCSDNVQMSRASGTTFDTTAVVQMTCMTTYTILSAVDNVPPTVTLANAVGFPVAANKTIGTSTNKVDVLFDEPVDLTTAQTTGNYAYTGPVARTIISAVRDGANTSLVHLTLNSTISANPAFHNITVTNVKDLATPTGNTIVANGTTNVGSFVIRNLAFQGNVVLRLCKGEFLPTDSIYVEGSLGPLTFAVGDNGRLLDANADSVYTGTIPFSIPKDRGTGKAEADLEWKLSHTPGGDPYEPGANRTEHLSSDSIATKTLSVVWGNDDPDNFTNKAIDVVFRVNGKKRYTGPGVSKIWVQGDQLPLSFTSFAFEMKDNGVAPDAVAGDSIYTAVVRFPRCTPKNVGWKVVYDSSGVDTLFECTNQGNREVFLNDEMFDIVGGPNGPIIMPARGVNRCNITDKAVAVTFKVFMNTVGMPIPAPGDSIMVMGNHTPRVTSSAHAFPIASDRPGTAASRLFDNGVPPDATAGDVVYSRTIVFPESTGTDLNFKYWWNTYLNFGFECEGVGDRTLEIDDVGHSVAIPMVRALDAFNVCRNLTDVGPVNPADGIAEFAVLRQSFPNPGIRPTIRFDLKRSGRVTLRVYDVVGRHVATVVDRDLAAGPHEAQWSARDSEGRRVRSGVYVYELSMGGERLTRRLVITR